VRLKSTSLAGVFVAENAPFRDARGAFQRLFCDEALEAVLGERRVRQINHSRTTQVGAIRGLHFQYPPHAEMKLVRCLRGRVWDVAVDLRRNSPTFLHWHAVELSPENGRMFVVPEGCAHGFQVLEADSELLYLHTAPYQPGSEGGVAFDEPRLAIAWPLPALDLSERDRNHPRLSESFAGIAP